MNEESARPRVGRVGDRLLAAACVAVMGVLGALILTFGYGRDQGIYAVVARSMLHGGMPYRDAWDFKPPGIFVVYALARALFGSAEMGIRIVEVAGLAAMAWSMTRISKTLWGSARPGYLAGAIAFVAHAELDFWHTAQPESFGGILTIFALHAAAASWGRGLEPGSRRVELARWVAAGVLSGAAALLKPPLGGAAVVLAAALAMHVWSSPTGDRPTSSSRLDSRARLAAAAVPVVAVAMGALAPIAVVVAWFAARGALSDLGRALFVFAPHYTSLSWAGQSIPSMFYWGFTDWLVGYSSVPTVGVLLFVVLRSRGERAAWVWVPCAIIGVQLVGVVLQGKFFPYHYGATWPVTALVAGLGYERAWRRATERGPVAVAAFFGACALVASLRAAIHDLPESFLVRAGRRARVALAGFRDVESMDDLASVADVNAGANRDVALWVERRAPADRPVFVWGFEPVIYELANREPATRYVYDVPQRVAWDREASRAALMADLAERPPAVVIVEHHDVFPAVTGDSADSAQALAGFEALRDLLADGYVLEGRIEDFDLYREAGAAQKAP